MIKLIQNSIYKHLRIEKSCKIPKVNNPLGPSNIPAWFLKECMNMMANPICYMINTFVSENKFPSHLKQAFVVPIFKQGDTEDPSKYGLISVIPTLTKLYERMLQHQVIDCLDKFRIFSSLHFGLRKHFSTTDALILATGKSEKIEANETVTAAFIELS